MNKRYLGAIILSPFIIFLFLGGPYLFLLTLLLSILGMYEFYKSMKQKNINALSYFGFIMCIIYYALIYKFHFINVSTAFINSFSLIYFTIIFLFFLLLCIPIFINKYNFIDVFTTFFGFIYIGIFFSFTPLVSFKHFGNYFVWLILISSFGCDTLALYTGKAFGKNKLCPKISPNKTVEGSLGGFIGSIILCGIYGILVNSRVYIMPISNFFIIGALCGIFGQIGDLVASSIKRYVGIKDYSDLIPGHGGILDRFDSILFSSVIVFYYITFIVGI